MERRNGLAAKGLGKCGRAFLRPGFSLMDCALAQVPRRSYRERMKKGVGVICLIGGVLMLVWGHGIAQSTGRAWWQAFTGSPPERAHPQLRGRHGAGAGRAFLHLHGEAVKDAEASFASGRHGAVRCARLLHAHAQQARVRAVERAAKRFAGQLACRP